MAGRLKRRSSVGLGRFDHLKNKWQLVLDIFIVCLNRDRRDSVGPSPAAFTPTTANDRDALTPMTEPATPGMEVGEVEEAAERRARNLQRRQNQMETEVADSPGLERQGSSTNRRSVGGISGLSHAQVSLEMDDLLDLDISEN